LVASWVAAELRPQSAFPPNGLQLTDAAVEQADSLLNDVRREIASTGEDVLLCFDVSRERYRFILQFMLPQPRGKVLDLGCAPGHGAMALAKAGFDVFGIDMSTTYLQKYASQDWTDRLHISQVDIEKEQLPYPAAQFESAVFTEVLEQPTAWPIYSFAGTH